MASRTQKRKKTTGESASPSYDTNLFRSQGCKNFYDTFPQKPSFVREKPLRLTRGDYPEIQENIRMRGWEKFVSYPKMASQALTYEFIANVNPQPAVDGALKFPPNTSWVRGCVVPFDHTTINELFEMPHVPYAECGYQDRLRRKPKADEENAVEILRTLCKPGADWERNGYGDPRKILTKNLNPIARGWADFILHTVCPCSNQTELHVPRACLATSIILGEQVSLGRVLQDELLEFSQIKIEKKEWWRHASLITLLCEKAGVVVGADEKVLEPGKAITGNWIRSRFNLVREPQIEPQPEPQPEHHPEPQAEPQADFADPGFDLDDFPPQPTQADFKELQARMDNLIMDQQKMSEELGWMQEEQRYGMEKMAENMERMQEEQRYGMQKMAENMERLQEQQRMGMQAMYRAFCASQRGERLDPDADIFGAPSQ